MAKIFDVCVIGAGAAGLMAAIWACRCGANVVLLESNTTAGRKLLLTGRGRCNLTHTGGPDDFIKVYAPFGRFVRHCLHEFGPDDLRGFFAERGLETVSDENGCVFPVTQRAVDVKKVLVREVRKLGAKTVFGRMADSIRKTGDSFTISARKEQFGAYSVVVATGGASRPETGSVGGGYKLAAGFGHNIVTPRACLVPLVTSEKWCGKIAGVGVKDAVVSAKIAGRIVSAAGPMLFTHDGIGGPAVLDLSRLIADYPALADRPVEVFVDFLPGRDGKGLDAGIACDCGKWPGKMIANVIAGYLPKALAEMICRQLGLVDVRAGQLKRADRQSLTAAIKRLSLHVRATRPIEQATVTRGGVDTDRIDRKTMESLLCEGLFFAGEVMNVDGPCGGYNLQFAFSSGAVAGKNAANSCGRGK